MFKINISFEKIKKNLYKRINLNRDGKEKKADSRGIYNQIWGREERSNILSTETLCT